MINAPSTKNTSVNIITYHNFLADIRREIKEGLQEITRLIEKEKVLRYWTIGRRINQFLEDEPIFSSRFQFYRNLEKDLEISARTLQHCEQFYRFFPDLKPDGRLHWSHYRYLLSVPKLQDRERWIERIYRDNLTSIQLREELSSTLALPADEAKSTVLNEPRRGVLYTYHLVRDESSWLVDCGFANRIEAPHSAAELHNKRLYTSLKIGDVYRLKIAADVRAEELYTFKAKLIRVIDGDTLLVLIDQGFGLRTEQRLRLKGIDAPELDTVPGRKAKTWAERQLTGPDFIIVKTYKSDKYDRYLVDIFYDSTENDPQKVASSGQWLNGQMIRAGMAVPWKEQGVSPTGFVQLSISK